MQSRFSETYMDGHLSVNSVNVGWHGWAVVYVPPWGWLPVDMTWKYLSSGKEEPEAAITGAALFKTSTIPYQNYSRHDYVQANRESRDSVISHSLYFSVKEELSFLGSSLAPPSLQPIEVKMSLVLAATSVMCIVGLLIHSWIKRRVEKNGQPVPR